MIIIREILFKARRTDNGEWVEGSLISNKDHSFIVEPVEYSCIGYCGECDRPYIDQYDVDPDTVCQYTGLTDKNGKKIWESDIVKFDIYEYENLVSSTISGIKWCENLCSLSVVVNKQGVRGTLGHFLDNNKEVEVIGNIFDNPELLNKGVTVK